MTFEPRQESVPTTDVDISLVDLAMVAVGLHHCYGQFGYQSPTILEEIGSAAAAARSSVPCPSSTPLVSSKRLSSSPVQVLASER